MSLAEPCLFDPVSAPHFDGVTYDPKRDHSRLHKQLTAVLEAMADGKWHTLARLSEQTGAPEASVSARIRDLRKEKFGGHKVERKRVDGGLFFYRLEGQR
jgi:biotin operon repressor